jgi:hypothetical protein
MGDLLLSEELLLLALDAEKGRDRTSWGADPGLAGALLLDLAEGGRLRADDERLVVAPGPMPGPQLLRDALAVLEEDGRPRKPKHWIDGLPRRLKPFKQRVAARLLERGVLRRDESKVLGLFPRTRYAELDAGPERALRDRLVGILVEGAEPDRRSALLLGLVRPAGLIGELVPREQRKAATRRAEEVAESGLVGTAVDRAVRDVQASILTASTAAIVASTAATAGGDGGGGGGS